jgi:hypothetical protein
MKFPANFGVMKFAAYDEQPINSVSKKAIQSSDPSHIARSGTPVAYFPYDETDDGYVLYPRPVVNFVNELAGEGLAFYAAGDDEDDTVGGIAVRSGSSDTDEGTPVDIVELGDSVFMVYAVSPTDVENLGDEPEFPGFLRKYLRYGTVGRAYSANTDGRIKSLGDFWQTRYELGVEFTKRWLRNKRRDRDYRLITRGVPGRRSYRYPRLPDAYPAVEP